jgi:hypothetical protein
MRWWRLCLLGLLLACGSGAARATSYTFPGAMPSGCSGSAGTYTCGSVTLYDADTVTINSPKPATITATSFDTHGAKINAAGSASDLTIQVTGSGAFKNSNGAVINANVTAGYVSSAGTVSYGGSLTATSSYVSLGGPVTVGGSISAKSYVFIGYNATRSTVNGSISAANNQVDVYNSDVSGSMTAGSYVNITSNTAVAGNATAATDVFVYSGSSVAQCVRSTTSDHIYNKSGSSIGGACCGSGSTCTNTCVHYSPKPPACQTLHHLELTTTSSSAAAGASVVYTIKACADAACSPYTWGVSGTLSISGVTPTYLTGTSFSIPSGSSAVTETVQMTAGTATASVVSPNPTPTNTPTVFCGMGVAAVSGNSCSLSVTTPLHHIELTASSNSAVTCQPLTYTVKACSDAACAPYTSGLTGTLSVTGVTVNYPAGAGFAIDNGSSTTTVSVHATTAGAATASLTGLSVAPSNSPSLFCGMGTAATSGGSCAITLVDSALIFDVPDHISGVTQSVNVSAVRSSDNSAVCTPAFTGVKSINFKCAYTNPTSGTLPVSLGSEALNAGNNSAAACDGTGKNVSLSFDGNGVASTTVRYADVGRMSVTARYDGSGSDAGLVMQGSDTFVATPYALSVSGVTSGNIAAGQSFSATVSALNHSNAIAPNFGREISPEGVALAFVRTAPTGSGASNGVFSGNVGGFSAGSATANNLAWSEVGRGDVTATLSSNSYLGTGMTVAGSTAGAMVFCGNENSTCTLPTGAVATIYYGASGRYFMKYAQTGAVPCSNGYMGDPYYGVAKSCSYVVTSGANPGASGAVGPFVPHHFTTVTAQACGSFTYSGQPFSATITAHNASNAVTINYDGTVNTSPNQAHAVTLSAGSNGGTGSMNPSVVSASSFNRGVATVSTPVFTFTNKLTGPTAIAVRAQDNIYSTVTSSGFTEGTLALRSGRIKMSNKYGSAATSLSVPVQTQYWRALSSGSGAATWVVNDLDSCTVVPSTAVVLGGYLDRTGAAASAWPATASGLTISSGNGVLTLNNPSSAVGSVDFALALGTTSTDQSCLNPARSVSSGASNVGARMAWLRSQYGSTFGCSGNVAYDRDPSARATFGVFGPETKKAVHVRDIF